MVVNQIGGRIISASEHGRRGRRRTKLCLAWDVRESVGYSKWWPNEV